MCKRRAPGNKFFSSIILRIFLHLNVTVKDYFSRQAGEYLRFRPVYPAAVFDYIVSLAASHNLAWDAGTGNGQVAVELAGRFAQVYATDISENQLKHAIARENIIYKIENASQCSLPDDSFDLVTVSQAIHWFDFETFYSEVKRTLKAEGAIAVIGYGLFRMNKKVDAVIDHFYETILSGFWNDERRYLDESYRTIPFPFDEITPPAFAIEYYWGVEQVMGYLRSWSAVNNYLNTRKEDPVQLISNDLKSVFAASAGNEPTGDVNVKLKAIIPVFMRVGRNKK
ncbi:MAG: class I SAM-dependent methyltransferase [Bacteroidia bacterium]